MMTYCRMKRIIEMEIEFYKLEKNSGIYEFYTEGSITAGISFEDDEEGKDTYIFNLFWNNDEYINIDSTGNNQETINELVKVWNKLLLIR